MRRGGGGGGGGGVVDVVRVRRLLLLSLTCCSSIWPGGRIFAAADTDPNDRELETCALTALLLLLPCEFVCLSARSLELCVLHDVLGCSSCSALLDSVLGTRKSSQALYAPTKSRLFYAVFVIPWLFFKISFSV
jgi:hypothetical protein